MPQKTFFKIRGKDVFLLMVRRSCSNPDCIKFPRYNTHGEAIGLYCNRHKRDGMVDVTTCVVAECTKRPPSVS